MLTGSILVPKLCNLGENQGSIVTSSTQHWSLVIASLWLAVFALQESFVL